MSRSDITEQETRSRHIAPAIKEAGWPVNRIREEYAWKVPVEEIEDRHYNLDIDNPHEDDEAISDPDELLARYESLQKEIEETRQSSKDELESALHKTIA